MQSPPRAQRQEELEGAGDAVDVAQGLEILRRDGAGGEGRCEAPLRDHGVAPRGRGRAAVLTWGRAGTGGSLCRSGDSEALPPPGDSTPGGGERLRSMTGRAGKRFSSALECANSPGPGPARRPPRAEPRLSPTGGGAAAEGGTARGRGPGGPRSRFSRALRTLEMLSLRSSGSSSECMAPGGGVLL